MLILGAATTTIKAITAVAPNTALPFVSSFVDITSSGFVPGDNQGTVNNADTTIVAAPGASTQRQLKFLSIYNIDNIIHTVTIKVDYNGTQRIIKPVLLPVGWTITYIDSVGWILYDANGQPVIGNSGYSISDTFKTNPGTVADRANNTTVTATATNNSIAMFLGISPKNGTFVDVLSQVGTAAATITWAEVGIFKGDLILNGNANLTRLGFTDVSGSFNTTGRKVTRVNCTVQIGDVLWVAYGSQATTPYQVRGALADDLQTGAFQTIAGRISTVASPTNWTLAGAAVVPPVLAAKIG